MAVGTKTRKVLKRVRTPGITPRNDVMQVKVLLPSTNLTSVLLQFSSSLLHTLRLTGVVLGSQSSIQAAETSMSAEPEVLVAMVSVSPGTIKKSWETKSIMALPVLERVNAYFCCPPITPVAEVSYKAQEEPLAT